MRIELTWDTHTPLKRARLPIPPRPQRIINILYGFLNFKGNEENNLFCVYNCLMLARGMSNEAVIDLPSGEECNLAVFYESGRRRVGLRNLYGFIAVFAPSAYQLKFDIIYQYAAQLKEKGSNYQVSYEDYFLGEKLSVRISDSVRKKKARELFQTLVFEVKKLMGISFDIKVNVGFYTSFYGCCYPNRQTISLDYRLSAFSPIVIKSMVVHELAHFFNRRHDEYFYALVLNACPDYYRLNGIIHKGLFWES